MKDTYYFSHDYNARTDIKIKRLISKHGLAGYGLFWAIVEDLYNNANALPMDCESIAFDLRVSQELVESVIKDFDLFSIDGNTFGSLSVERRLNERSEKSKKAQESANLRWQKHRQECERIANAKQTQSDGNAIKERKGKEIKGNEIKEREEKFIQSLRSFSHYPPEMIEKFISYWTEVNKSGTKMRFESEKFFDLSRRLQNWAGREKSFKQQTGKQTVEERLDIYQQGKKLIQDEFGS